MKRTVCALAVSVVMSGAIGCGSSSNNGPPQIVITSPQSGTNVNLPADNTATVSFSASNFALKTKGTCGNATNCGQVYANIDGDACDQSSANPYNAIAPSAGNSSTSSLKLDFSLCPASGFAGSHAVALSLRRDDGTTIIGVGNALAVAQITINTTGGSVQTSHDGGVSPPPPPDGAARQ